MSYYPPSITAKLEVLLHSGRPHGYAAEAVEAAFVCGTYVRFFLTMNPGTSEIEALHFESNGCGYVLALADCLCDWISGKELGELRGLSGELAVNVIEKIVSDIPEGRQHCSEMCIRAVRSVFAEYRANRLAQYNGDDPLVCTCFGIGENRIEELIASGEANTVEEVAAACNAGIGCGSCRMLIQEIIESKPAAY